MSIVSFRNKATEKVFNREYTSKYSSVLRTQAFSKMIQLDVARNIASLKMPPLNHLEQLKRDRKGQWSYKTVFESIKSLDYVLKLKKLRQVLIF